MRDHPARAATLLLAALAACATPQPERTLGPAFEQALAELQVEQRRIAAEVTVPMELRFPGHGHVTVRDFSLDGFPGNTYLRARFHYTNTTGKSVHRVTVRLDILDAQNRLVASQASVLTMPFALTFAPETMFADELRTQTHGLHRLPGWSWRFDCQAEFEN